MKRADDGFEDRGGHQAPITLRGKCRPNIEHPTLNVELPTGKGTASRLFDVRCSVLDVPAGIRARKSKPPTGMRLRSEFPFDRLENRVEVGEFARLQFGINFLPMDADFEGATT